MKSKKLIILVVLIIILGAGSAFAYNFIKENKLTEKERLIEGYKNLAENSSPLNDTLGTKELVEKLEKNQGKYTMEATVDELSELKDIEGLGANVECKYNLDKKKSENVYGITYRGTQLVSADVYLDDKCIYASVPEFLSEVFKLDLSKIEKSKDDSYILSEIPDELWDEFDLSVIDRMWDSAKTVKKDKDGNNTLEIVSDFIDTYPDDVKLIEKGIKVKEKKAGELELAISANAIKVFINDCATFVFDNEKYADVRKQMIDGYNENVDEDQQMTEKQMKNQCSSIATTLSAFFGEGLKLTTNLNDDNEITKIKFNYSYSILNYDISFDYNMKFTGKEHTSDKYEGSIVVKVGEETATFDIVGNTKRKGNVTNVEKKVTLTVLDEEFAYATDKITFDSKKGTYTEEIELSADNEKVDMSIEGCFKDIKKGQSFKFDLDSFVVTYDDFTAKLSGSFSADTKCGKIQKPDNGKEMDLLKMTEKDFKKIEKEFDKNVDSISKEFSEVFEEY